MKKNKTKQKPRVLTSSTTDDERRTINDDSGVERLPSSAGVSSAYYQRNLFVDARPGARSVPALVLTSPLGVISSP